jgi:16S rRNA processing protein RimM
MMDEVSLFCLGKISKTFGYKGQVIVIANCDDPEKYKKLEFVFVDIQHERVPFFITEFNFQYKNSVELKLEDIDSSDEAQKLIGCSIYIPELEVIADAKEEFYITDLAGYEVTDVNVGYLGRINQILELPQQNIIQIFQDKKEILIPLNEDFIKKIDFKKKSIKIAAPEGLIEFYQQ